MKNALSEMKIILEGIDRVYEQEDQIINIEDGEAKEIQSQWQEKSNQGYNNNLRNAWSKIKGKNIHVIGIPEVKVGEQEVEKLSEQTVMDNFSHLVKKIELQPRKLRESPLQKK